MGLKCSHTLLSTSLPNSTDKDHYSTHKYIYGNSAVKLSIQLHPVKKHCTPCLALFCHYVCLAVGGCILLLSMADIVSLVCKSCGVQE